MGLFSTLGGIVGGSFGGPVGGGIGGGLGGLFDGDDRPEGAPGSAITGGAPYSYTQYEREKVLPSYLQQPYEDTVSAVMQAGQEPFKPYEYQFRPELFAPDEITAQNLYRNIPSKYAPYIQGGLDVLGESQRMALQGPSEQLIQGYMNPFIGQVLDVQQQRALEDFQRQGRDLRSRAGQVGSFGGSRFGIAESQLYDDFRQRQNEMESKMLMAGYDRALAGLERGLERGMDPQYIGGLQAAELGGIDALRMSGERQYQRDFGEFMREVSDPMLKAGFLARNIQPLAATVMGERGSTMSYGDPNAGAIGQGIGLGATIEGLLGGGDFLGEGLGGLGSSLGLWGGNDPLSGITWNSGRQGGGGGFLSSLGNIGSSIGNIGSSIGGFFGFNEGGRIGYQSGGFAADPYSIYLSAASSGNFVSPAGFGAMPVSPIGMDAITSEGGAGGLLDAIEDLTNAEEEDEESGKEVPGAESPDIQEEVAEEVEAKNRGGIAGYNDGSFLSVGPLTLTEEQRRAYERGELDPWAELSVEDLKGITAPLDSRIDNYIANVKGPQSYLDAVTQHLKRSDEEFSRPINNMTNALDESLNRGIENIERLSTYGPKSLNKLGIAHDRFFDMAPTRAAEGLSKLDLLQRLEELNTAQDYYLGQEAGITSDMNRAQRLKATLGLGDDKAIGAGLAALTAIPDLGVKIGEYFAGNPEAEEAQKYFDEKVPQKKYQEQAEVLTNFLKGQATGKIPADASFDELYTMLDARANTPSDIAAAGALESAIAGPAATIGPDGTIRASEGLRDKVNLKTVGDVRKEREGRKTLKTSAQKAAEAESRRRSALLAFGASMTQGGGLGYSLPRAALAYDNAIKTQEAAAFNRQLQLAQLENETRQKDINEAQMEASIQKTQKDVDYYDFIAQTERMKAEGSLRSNSKSIGDLDILKEVNRLASGQGSDFLGIAPGQQMDYAQAARQIAGAIIAITANDPRSDAQMANIKARQLLAAYGGEGGTTSGGTSVVTPEEYLKSK